MDLQSGHSAYTMSASNFSSSSRTGSSRSGFSEREREPDYTRDNTITPIDLEALIQTERITKILDECVYKTKLAICLPNLVKEFNTLSSIISSQNMDDLVFIFEQYDIPMSTSSLLNATAMEEIRAGELTLKHRLNPELGHLLYIINSYPALKPIVEEMVEKGKKLPLSLDYLAVLERFRNLMVEQMSTLAADEFAAKLNTKKLEKYNAKLLDNIKGTTETLTRENQAFEAKMALKREKIEQLESELSATQADAATELKQKILDSERQMVLASRVHDVKNEVLQEEQIEAQRTYDKMHAEHVKNEKKLRGRRFKVETQLISWIQKYDVEMSDKQLELDDFQRMYDEEVEKCRNLEKQLEIQNIDYIPLMEERDQEYHKEMMAKMEKFRMEHAARIIQGAWRNTLANRAEKKKLKKAYKKMIAAAEAAEGLQKEDKPKEAKSKEAKLKETKQKSAKQKEVRQKDTVPKEVKSKEAKQKGFTKRKGK